MAEPATVETPLYIYRGDTFIKKFTIAVQVDPDSDVLTPVDLTLYGGIWAAQLRQSENAEDMIPFTVDTSNLALGQISIRLDAEVSADIPSKGVWDIQVIDEAQTPAFVRTVLRGTFVRVKDVTRI